LGGSRTPNIMPCLCTVQVVVGYLFSILPRQFYVPIDTEAVANASYAQCTVRWNVRWAI